MSAIEGTDGNDTLTNIEYLQFDDTTITLGSTVASDFDGDGKSDILWTSTSGAVAIWLMDGTTMTSSAFVATPGTEWSVVGTGDYDGDGKADILWKNTSDNTYAVWTMSGTSMSSSTFLSSTPGSVWSAVA
jgi:hypothetical protein